MSDADSVVVSGCSAGAVAAALHVDAVQLAVPEAPSIHASGSFRDHRPSSDTVATTMMLAITMITIMIMRTTMMMEITNGNDNDDDDDDDTDSLSSIILLKFSHNIKANYSQSSLLFIFIVLDIFS